MNSVDFDQSEWGLKVNRNGWLVCLTRADLKKAAVGAGYPADQWREIAGASKLPCLVHWIPRRNPNAPCEIVTVFLEDAIDLISLNKSSA